MFSVNCRDQYNPWSEGGDQTRGPKPSDNDLSTPYSVQSYSHPESGSYLRLPSSVLCGCDIGRFYMSLVLKGLGTKRKELRDHVILVDDIMGSRIDPRDITSLRRRT